MFFRVEETVYLLYYYTIYNLVYRIVSRQKQKRMPSLRRQNVQGPSGGAGLIRYFDVDEGGPKLSPMLIMGIVVAMIALEILSNIIFH